MKTFISICFLISLFAGYSSGSEFPSDVKRLVSNRNVAAVRIDEIFDKELERLLVKYTKMGDLESANKINALIKTNQESLKAMKEKISLQALTKPGNWEKKLTEMKPIHVTVGYDRFLVNEGTTTPLIDNKPCADFLFAHADSLIRYKIPSRASYFTAKGCSSHSKSVSFKVIIDGQVAFKSKSLSNYSKGYVDIKVKIPSNAKNIELITDSLGDAARDHTCWAYPEFIGIR